MECSAEGLNGDQEFMWFNEVKSFLTIPFFCFLPEIFPALAFESAAIITAGKGKSKAFHGTVKKFRPHFEFSLQDDVKTSP